MERTVYFLDECMREDGHIKTKNSLVNEIENYKAKGMIAEYKIVNSRVLEYEIFLNNGDKIRIIAEKEDFFLNSIDRTLKSKKVEKDQAFIHAHNNTVWIGKSLDALNPEERTFDQIMSLFKCMQKNDEISIITRTGNDTIKYVIETKDHEEFTVVTTKENEMIVNELDRLMKIRLRKNRKSTKAAFIAAASIALVFTAPYTKAVIGPHVNAYLEKQDKQDEIANNLMIMKSDALALKTNNASKEQIEELRTLVNVTMSYFEENNMTKDKAYEEVKEYEDILNEYSPGIIWGR